MWTAAIAATLLFLSSRSLSFVENLQKWFYPIGWGYGYESFSNLIFNNLNINISIRDISVFIQCMIINLQNTASNGDNNVHHCYINSN